MSRRRRTDTGGTWGRVPILCWVASVGAHALAGVVLTLSGPSGSTRPLAVFAEGERSVEVRWIGDSVPLPSAMRHPAVEVAGREVSAPPIRMPAFEALAAAPAAVCRPEPERRALTGPERTVPVARTPEPEPHVLGLPARRPEDEPPPPELRSPTGTDPRPPPAASPGVTRAARPGSAIAPRYPESCRRLGHEGTVQIECTIDATGRVTSARVTRSAGCPDLDAAALEAVRGAVFVPAHEGGRPVPSVAVLPVRFELR